METELSSLEEKVIELIGLIGELRAENRELRQQQRNQEAEVVELRGRIGVARERIESLVNRLPDTGEDE